MRGVYSVTMLVLALGSCRADLRVPDGIVLACDDDSDCVAGSGCFLTDDGTARVCITDGVALCGNGVQEAGEFCDHGPRNSDDYHFTPTCLADCSGFGEHCGDGTLDALEECDDGNMQDDGNGCSNLCKRCNGLDDCPESGPVVCGDSRVHMAFEACDDGNAETEECPYGTPVCYVCDARCEVQEKVGPYCGDGIVQQRGLVGGSTLYTGTQTDGLDSREWEGCDSGANNEPVACSSLHPDLGDGFARCGDGCVKYDTSACSNQEVVFVPGGPFMMGCNTAFDGDCWDEAELPFHEVYLDSFVIHKYEVTARTFRNWCNESPELCGFKEFHDYHMFFQTPWYVTYQTFDNNRDDHPITGLDHFDALEYCTAKGMRLPTEAEWEKAARGTDGRIFPWGSQMPTCERAVVDGWGLNADGLWVEGYGCGENRTWAVGSKLSGVSIYGAMDMSGNVWEWVADWFQEGYYYDASALENPQGPLTGENRVLRGGSFYSMSSLLRSSARLSWLPSSSGARDIGGIRCAN